MAIMAPTSILASQHLESFTEILKDFDIRCELLISNMPAKKKAQIIEEIKNRRNRCCYWNSFHTSRKCCF